MAGRKGRSAQKCAGPELGQRHHHQASCRQGRSRSPGELGDTAIVSPLHAADERRRSKTSTGISGRQPSPLRWIHGAGTRSTSLCVKKGHAPILVGQARIPAYRALDPAPGQAAIEAWVGRFRRNGLGLCAHNGSHAALTSPLPALDGLPFLARADPRAAGRGPGGCLPRPALRSWARSIRRGLRIATLCRWRGIDPGTFTLRQGARSQRERRHRERKSSRQSWANPTRHHVQDPHRALPPSPATLPKRRRAMTKIRESGGKPMPFRSTGAGFRR